MSDSGPLGDYLGVLRPVSFLFCLSGGSYERQRVLGTVRSALRPGDEALAAVCDFGPVPAATHDRIPDGIRILALPHAPLPKAFDRMAEIASHDTLIVVGSGASIDPADLSALRQSVDSDNGPVAVLTASVLRTTATSAFPHRLPAMSVTRTTLASLGGMSAAERRARRIDSGMIGTAEMIECFERIAGEAGIPLGVVAARTKFWVEGGDQGPAVNRDGQEYTDGDLPPSRRIQPELRSALAPTASATASWLAPVLTEDQRTALAQLLEGTHDTDQPDPNDGHWTRLDLARMLSERGLGEQAAGVLEQSHLSSSTEVADIAEIVRLMSNANRPLADLLVLLAHVPLQLATIIAGQVSDAEAAFDEWFRRAPDPQTISYGLSLLATSLPITKAVMWHSRLRGTGARSPLAAIVEEGSRTPIERLLALQCLEIEGIPCSGNPLDDIIRTQPPEVLEASRRAAMEMLELTGLRATGSDPSPEAAAVSATCSPAPRPGPDSGRPFHRDPLVSVCIPTYNRAHLIRDAIESVLAQDGVSFELLIADNASTDNTMDVVSEYARRDSRVQVIANPENIECYPNCTNLAGLARGAYVKFLMDDDTLLPGTLTRMSQALEDPSISMVTARLQEVDEFLHNPVRPEWTFPMGRDGIVPGKHFGDYSLANYTNFANSPTGVMYRRASLDPTQFAKFDGVHFAWAGDYATWLTLMLAGNVAYFVEPVANVRRHGQQGTVDSVHGPVAAIETLFLTRLAERRGFLKDPDSRHRAYTLALKNLVVGASFHPHDPWTPVVNGAIRLAESRLQDLVETPGITSEQIPWWWRRALSDLRSAAGIDEALPRLFAARLSGSCLVG